MPLNDRIKKSTFFTILIYVRYLFKRFVFFRAYKCSKLVPGAKIEPVSDTISFFGYYNISPVNDSGEILYLEVSKELKRGSLAEPARIMLKKDAITRFLSQSKSWNWQQGCMLQWFGEMILYNDYDSSTDTYRAKVMNREGEILQHFSLPVSNVSRCGKYAVVLNYDRLTEIRPTYGYFNRKNRTFPDDRNDGIWYLSMTTGESKLIVTLEHLKKLSYSDTMNGAIHKINHLDINPTGSRVMFLHRWNGPGGRFMRLITCNPDGTDLFILNGDKMVSHCCWLNEKDILSFCNYQGKVGYFLFKDLTKIVRLFSENMPHIDGHPSMSRDGKYLITDCYPDGARMSKLFLYEMNSNRIIELGRFHQPFRYKGEQRIDLHPKWGRDSKIIFFESGHLGKRQLFKLNISGLIS